MSIKLSTELKDVKGFNTKSCSALEKIGYTHVGHILAHYPRRYENRDHFNQFPDLPTDSASCYKGIVVKCTRRFFGRRRLFEATIIDPESSSHSRITLRWFNMPFIHKIILEDQEVIFYGKVKKSGSRLIIDHPEFEIISSENFDSSHIHLARITPIYPLPSGISQRPLRAAIFNLLQNIPDNELQEILPKNEEDPISRPNAIRQIHFPDSEELMQVSRQFLALEEFFILQLRVAYRKSLHNNLDGSIHLGTGKLIGQFLESLPFNLTKAQTRCVEEIHKDMAEPRPMNRILQGDVGSGKTLVAVCAILRAIESNCHAVLMAPTQILAEQHFSVLSRWLSPLGIDVYLFTSKKKTVTDASLFKNQNFRVVVGTHALLYQSSKIENLGLVVIDEQHKFGVTQRQELINRGSAPDVLVMTATPIPRTLTLTVYGDLDVSVIDELPPGRGSIKTYMRDSKKHLKKAIIFLKEQIENGRQAYVVYPLIEDSDKLDASSVEGEFQNWCKYLEPNTCELIHGKIKPEVKDEIMERFRSGTINVLISTTVIEVGVDVPNASVMYIFNAERFGLAQLHQLRGRIGRGQHTSYCILMTDKPSSDAKEKLKVLEDSSDGFVIADADLRIRGPGEILGKAQSGLDGLKLGDLLSDTDLVRKAQALAADLISKDPLLTKSENSTLKVMVDNLDQNNDITA